MNPPPLATRLNTGWLSWHWWQCHWHHMTSHDTLTIQCHSIRQSIEQVMMPCMAVDQTSGQFFMEFPLKIWHLPPCWPASDLMAWWHPGCLGHGSMGAPGLWEPRTPRHRHKWIGPGVWNSGQAHQLAPDTSTRGREIHQKCVRNWESYLENAFWETSAALWEFNRQ